VAAVVGRVGNATSRRLSEEVGRHAGRAGPAGGADDRRWSTPAHAGVPDTRLL